MAIKQNEPRFDEIPADASIKICLNSCEATIGSFNILEQLMGVDFHRNIETYFMILKSTSKGKNIRTEPPLALEKRQALIIKLTAIIKECKKHIESGKLYDRILALDELVKELFGVISLKEEVDLLESIVTLSNNINEEIGQVLKVLFGVGDNLYKLKKLTRIN